MKRNCKAIALLLVVAMILSSLAGCGGRNGGTPDVDDGPKDSGKSKKTEKIELSPEMTCATTKDGVTVDVGPYILSEEAELTVKKMEAEENEEEGYKVQAYDIALGDLHELNGFITIRLPFDTDYCEEGQDPAKCVGAMYKNEATGEWEDVLFETDPDSNELIIYTDHFSYYGVFYFENEGKRNQKITDVLDGGLYMSSSDAIRLSKLIAEDDPSVVSELAEYGIAATGKFFDYADRLDNAINMATLGDVPEWLSTEIPETNQTLFSAIGYVATATNILKVAANDAMGKGVDKGEVLNLIRDVSNKVTAYWSDAFTSVGSSALSVGMGGVLIIDKMLTAFAEEAYSTKLEDISYVYHHFNESFSGFGHTPMTAKDWREKAIEVVDKYPNDPEMAITALDAAFRKYSSEFFDLTQDQQSEVASEVEIVEVKNIPYISEADQEKLTEDYIAHLKDQVMPGVLKSVENYMILKVQQQQLEAMNKVKDYYNTKITIHFEESTTDEGESKYKGYQLRFAPLSEGTNKESWTGTWGSGHTGKMTATLLGFASAGFPHTVEFYPPGVDMDTTDPEFTIPFVISVPEINVTIAGMDVNGVEGFLGDWLDPDGKRVIFIRNGGYIIKKDPDLSWYAGDVCVYEFTPSYDASSYTLNMKGITGWVEPPEDLYSIIDPDDRYLVIDASSLNYHYTAIEAENGVVTKMTNGQTVYTRGNND